MTCELGISYVGWTMICFGVVNTVGSPLVGVLSKYIGRITLCWIATCINLAVLGLMNYWTPDQHEKYVFFIIPGAWGLGDAVWQTQSGGTNVSYVSLIDRKSVVFASMYWPYIYNLSSIISIGFIILVGLLHFICADKNEPPHDKTNKIACAPSEDSK